MRIEMGISTGGSEAANCNVCHIDHSQIKACVSSRGTRGKPAACYGRVSENQS